MPDTIACPQCGRRYPYRSQLVGRTVQCRACGHAFCVPGRAEEPMSAAAAYPPTDGSSSKSAGLEGVDDLLSQPLEGSPLPAEALRLPSVVPRRPRRRMTDREKVLLGVGGGLAACGLALLLLLATLGIASGLAAGAGLLVGLAGVVLAGFALRGNPLAAVATGVGLLFTLLVVALLQPSSSDVGPGASTSDQGTLGSALGNLLFGSSVPQTIPPFAGETSQDPIAQMTALVHLMESIRDESSLRELRPRILELFGQMLETEGRRVAPQRGPEVEQALPQFDQRMVAASQRLEVIPGGLELRRKLVKLIERTPIPAPPAGTRRPRPSGQSATVGQATGGASPSGPAGEDDQVGPLPTIASWVVWGWATPPPPEPAEDRQRRRATVEAAGGSPDAICVYVRGVTSDSLVKKIKAKVLEASQRMVVAPTMAGEVREFHCGKVEDFRVVAYRLDVGPIVKIEERKGILHVKLDPSKLFVRPGAPASGPIPRLDFQQAGIPAASSVALPTPPEPADVRRRREDVRWDAGQNLEGVEVVLHGSDEELNRLARQRLAALEMVKKVRSPNTGYFPRTIHCDDVGDMRVFAGQLDLGTIIQYDDQKGVIAVVVDPARLAEP